MSTPVSDRTWIARQIVVALGLVVVGVAAFRLSFDAQTKLAVAAGTEPSLAWLYPLAVDAAIVIVTLIAVWNQQLARRLRNYLWVSLGVWTAASIAGNALHLLALDPASVTVPFEIAIAVSAMPAVTLFLSIHIAVTTVFRRRQNQPAASVVAAAIAPRPTPRRGASARAAEVVSDEQLMTWVEEENRSYQSIADQIGRSKSWVGERVALIRKQRQQNADPAPDSLAA